MKKAWQSKLFLLFICTSLFLMSSDVSSIYAVAFSFQEEDAVTILDEPSSYEIVHEERTYERVGDYSVSPTGKVAVSTNSYINIYDENGTFLYGILVTVSTGAYAIEFKDTTIELFRIRTNDLIVLDDTGNVIKALEIQQNPSNQAEMSRIRNDMRSSKKETEEYICTLNTTLSEVMLQKKDSASSLKVYQMNTGDNARDFIFAAFICIAAFTAAIIAVLHPKQKSQK